MFISGISESHFARLLITKLLPGGYWHEGKSKVFMKADSFVVLIRKHKEFSVRVIQRRWRGYKTRLNHHILKTGLIAFWFWYRKWKKRKQWKLAVKGMTLLYHRIRYKIAIRNKRLLEKWKYYQYFISRWLVNIRLKKRYAVSLILLLMRRRIWRRKVYMLPPFIYNLQAIARGRKFRNDFQAMKRSAIRIQCFWKRITVKKRFEKLVSDARIFIRLKALVNIAKHGNYVFDYLLI